MVLKILLINILLCCQLSSVVAQTSEGIPFARWYGSVQYGRQNYQIFTPHNLEPWLTNQRRPQLSVGYQLNPRWAIQASWSPAYYSSSDSLVGTNSKGQPTSESSWGKQNTQALSLVARYTFKKLPFPKIQVELFAGPMLFFYHNWGNTIRTENKEIIYQRSSNVRETTLYMLAGPGISYSFGRHFQATADFIFNKSFRGTLTQYNVSTTGNSLGINHSYSIGLRYRFLYK